MNPGQLGALFQAHKPAVVGTAAAAVAGLALLQRRKKTTPSTGAATAGATVPGTIPAAGVVSGGGYDSSVTDLYNALQPQLEAIMQTTGAGIASAPDPVASSLFSPTYDGQYVQAQKNNGGNGPGIFEVEGDGSLLHLTQQQWDTAITKAGYQPNTPQADSLYSKLDSGWNGSWFNTSSNIGAASSGGHAGAVTLDPSTGRVVPVKTAST